MSQYQSTDKFFELFDDCQEIIGSIRFDIKSLRRSPCQETQLDKIKKQVEQLKKCSLAFSFIGLNEVIFDFKFKIEKNQDKDYYPQAVLELLHDLELAYTDFFSKLRVSQSLSSKGFHLQKVKKRDLL